MHAKSGARARRFLMLGVRFWRGARAAVREIKNRGRGRAAKGRLRTAMARLSAQEGHSRERERCQYRHAGILVTPINAMRASSLKNNLEVSFAFKRKFIRPHKLKARSAKLQRLDYAI